MKKKSSRTDLLNYKTIVPASENTSTPLINSTRTKGTRPRPGRSGLYLANRTRPKDPQPKVRTLRAVQRSPEDPEGERPVSVRFYDSLCMCDACRAIASLKGDLMGPLVSASLGGFWEIFHGHCV